MELIKTLITDTIGISTELFSADYLGLQVTVAAENPGLLRRLGLVSQFSDTQVEIITIANKLINYYNSISYLIVTVHEGFLKKKAQFEKICPFTLEPVANCRLGKLLFGGKPCPFSLEGCLSRRLLMQPFATIQ